MRVFVTGATGFLGSAIVGQLINAGHQVLGLTRSEAGVQSLLSMGAQAHIGDIENLDSLQHGASLADAVIHTAFNHDFSTFVANCETDRQAIEAMGSALLDSDRPLIITSIAGLGAMTKGQLASEEYFNADSPNPRKASELAGIALAQRGVNVSVVRLPQVHDCVKQGLISPLIELAREKGVSAYLNDGENRWAAVHINDAARLYVLALEIFPHGFYAGNLVYLRANLA
ncbi:NAD-dependent epimerase/dehydratase family protein [Providencia burhodogranariea]|uniref:NAD-dependent epimerase/dehydratase n=1 Tax=Providencia burhodogranariea DSM 19968 TaxID=1141662 RepID=K8X4B6_9GAMM|nr:NAD-dependent epimerase/dehydratase [Providencia burhodogranariea DSM 19968]